MRFNAFLRSLGVTAGVVGLAALGLWGGVFARFERSSMDLLFPRGDLDPRVVVVGIDGEALAAEATAWPWPREAQARLLEAVAAQGPAVIGLDVLLAEPAPGDDALIDAAARAGNVVAVAVPSGLVPGDHDLQRAVALAEPLPALADVVATAHGVITEDPSDGVARRSPLVIEAPDGRFLPSLALAMAAIAEGSDPVPVVRPSAVQVGSHAAPTGSLHRMAISYAAGLAVSPGSSYVSAADVLSGEVPPGALEGKLVLIGVTDATLGDNHRTPLDNGRGEPGVFIHAQALDTLLQDRYLSATSDSETLLWCAALSLLVLLASQLYRLLLAPVVALVVLLGYAVVLSWSFDGGTAMDPIYPPLALLLALAGGLVLRYRVEIRQRRRVSALFSRYVPAAVAADLLADDDRAAAVLAGQRLHVAVLFCDLRGFTPLSALLPATDVRRLLDVFYRHVTRPVLERGGTVVQFIGDEVYAVFGAPLPVDGPEQLALDCALAMQAAVTTLASDLVAEGLPPVRYGIGVHAGEGIAAQVGTDVRSQYSVVGSVVNVGSRLCSIADADGIALSDVIRSRSTCEADLEDVGEVQLKGVTDPVQIWSIGPVRNAVRV